MWNKKIQNQEEKEMRNQEEQEVETKNREVETRNTLRGSCG